MCSSLGEEARPQARTPTSPISQLLLHDCWGAGQGGKPYSCLCLARPPAPALELRPEPLGKGPCACQTFIYCPPFSGAQGQARQDSAGHCWLQMTPSRALKGNTANSFISKSLRRSGPACLTSPLLLSGWTK